MERKIKNQILKDLKKKMVFLVGPRQVGKTWLSKNISKNFKNPLYLNFDNFDDRMMIKKSSWSKSTDLVVFDEIHKMKNWKNYLKGLFDTKEKKIEIMVTGSAKLNSFRFVGDSMAGRFFIHRLMPFSLDELKNSKHADIDKLINRGGFPEPLLAKNENEAERWRKLYVDRLITGDIFDLDQIQDLQAIKMLIELLRRKVGSPISYQSISEDIQISPKTVKKYIDILEALYIIFKVTPFSRNIARSILKEPKIYFFDNGMVIGNNGAKFENMLALSLLSYVYSKEDLEGKNLCLNYLRTKDGKEVDFCITDCWEAKYMIEAKYNDGELSKNLLHFYKKYNVKAFQISKELRHEKNINGIEIREADKFLTNISKNLL